MIADTTRDLPALWDVGVEAARASREAGASVLGPVQLSSRAETFTIDGPSGPLTLRVIRPRGAVHGIYLHLHGGGWALGAPHHGDMRSEHLADATGLVVVAPTYRLAPEFRYPAGPDDCETAALWLVENAGEAFGTNVLTIGGESAGAHLAMVIALRLRDRLGSCPFVAAAYMYGIYDLRGTPSCLNFGDRPLILNSMNTKWFVTEFVGDADLTNPDVSPLFADVKGLPPALFLCGDVDPLIDDTLFMEAKYRAMGNHTALEIWPGGIHAFDYFDNEYGQSARRSIHEFLAAALAGA